MNEAFQVHILNEDGKQRASDIALAFDCLLKTLEDFNGTNTREMSIVKTKLEEACFFAKKAMANQPQYSAALGRY
jgi:hypothetical protein